MCTGNIFSCVVGLSHKIAGEASTCKERDFAVAETDP